MEKTLSAEEMPLYKVFSDDFSFTVPAVQRPYSWTTDEAGDLLDDLLDYIDHHGITEDSLSKVNEPYFLGSIVLVKKNSGKSQYDILDGQQRLTTLTILLSVLRDYLGGEYARTIRQMIAQEGNMFLNTKDQYRLELRKMDQLFFQQFVQEDGATTKLKKDMETKTDSQKCIQSNALYFLNRLNEESEKKIKMLPAVIYSLCYIVVVSTPNFDSAFRIFTVLNDRGLDLMPSDIFKATAIGSVPEEEQYDYTQKWEEVEVALGRDRFNKLFDHIRMIIQKRKGSANLKDEYDEIFKKIKGKQFIDEYLIPYSEMYLKLVDYQTHFRESPQMIKLLSLMNRIDNVDWMTVAMYYMKNHPGEEEPFLQRLEKFAAVNMIVRKNFNWRMSKYSLILKEMANGIDVFSKTSTMEIMPNDCKEALRLLRGDVYTELKDTAKRYVMLRLDSLLTAGQPYYNYSVITVEHVLPQTPKENSEWLKNFPQPEEYVHKLGNLVLLTRKKNSQAKNYDFQKKKTSYFQEVGGATSFALTSQVVRETEWTPATIQRRQAQLIHLLSKAWGLEGK